MARGSDVVVTCTGGSSGEGLASVVACSHVLSTSPQSDWMHKGQLLLTLWLSALRLLDSEKLKSCLPSLTIRIWWKGIRVGLPQGEEATSRENGRGVCGPLVTTVLLTYHRSLTGGDDCAPPRNSPSSHHLPSS